MDNDIKEIKHYIKIKDYKSLEELLGVFMIPTNKLQNKNFDILCYSIECGCSIKFIKQIFKWCKIEEVNYYYFINNKLISPLFNSFIYKRYEIIEFLIKKGANINIKYNDMTLLKYLITNEYFIKDFISILVKHQYAFSRNDFNLLIQKDFDLVILAFEEITVFNKDIENKYNNNYNDNNNNNINSNKMIKEKKKITKNDEKESKKEINEKYEKKENEMIFKNEISISFMWYISYFRKREFNKILELFKYETSKERCRGLNFFDNHFNYLDKKCENDIKLQFLYEIINKHIEIPKFLIENKKEFLNEIYLKNQFNRILIKKHELYSKFISNNDYKRINKFKKNNKFFLDFMQKPPK
ncbi:hypothetical protein H8356DRAFT_1089613 [Neocallimastix lanati (nom. inval.)]|uniref:Ankyrin n=1 Tax=Neocallimastix californiae TaxID=1754190 RepID=A0A1Y1Z584_9FUNG|nr:hypothetical protein H8356DRAFT_1089613 [Neocallimastix sp. JGI-2020a]ORY05137.1 hypothetical protein LY90DRAFT_519361 [Neocallimastix californiae]|eukprot:ORY05137.1 hypothetical protein LY90DRAFT_519361 [Neocallimastix californiae]